MRPQHIPRAWRGRFRYKAGVEQAAGHTGRQSGRAKDKGLKKGAIGFTDGLAIGLASTAPAYSLAAVIGSVVVVVGVQAPSSLQQCRAAQLPWRARSSHDTLVELYRAIGPPVAFFERRRLD